MNRSCRRQSPGNRPGSQQGRRQQRDSAAVLEAPLENDGGERKDGCACQEDPGPCRPSIRLAFGERDEQRDERGGEEQSSANVDGRGMLGARPGYESGDGDERGETDGDVDPEDRSPRGACDVDGDQEPAGELAHSDCQPGGCPVEASRAVQPGSLECGMEGSQDLGDDERRRGALQETGTE